jgi:EpsI family protein
MSFMLPGGSFQVANVCAGLRYLSAAVTLAVLFSYLTYRSPWRWIVFIVTTVIAFILANGLRASFTMWVASETRWHDFTGPGHVWMGRLLFFVVILGMFALGRRFSDLPARKPEAADARDVANGRYLSIGSAAAALCLLLLGPQVAAMRSQAAANRAIVAKIPRVEGCDQLREWPLSWTPSFRGADAVIKTGYECGSAKVGLYKVTYFSQRQGKELVNEGNTLLPPAKEEIADTRDASFAAPGTHRIPVNVVNFSTIGQSGLGWSWYAVGSNAQRSGLRVKVLQALDALVFRARPSTAYVVMAVADDTGSTDLAPVVERVARAAWATYNP